MSHVIVNLLIIMAAAIGLTWLIGMVTARAAMLADATKRRRADRCACGQPLQGARAWTRGGVRHERDRCQPSREVV